MSVEGNKPHDRAHFTCLPGFVLDTESLPTLTSTTTNTSTTTVTSSESTTISTVVSEMESVCTATGSWSHPVPNCRGNCYTHFLKPFIFFPSDEKNSFLSIVSLYRLVFSLLPDGVSLVDRMSHVSFCLSIIVPWMLLLLLLFSSWNFCISHVFCTLSSLSILFISCIWFPAAVSCPELESEDPNLKIEVMNRIPVSSQALFSCPEGFKLSGVSSSSCLKNGSWSHPLPSCEGKNKKNKDMPLIFLSFDVSHDRKSERHMRQNTSGFPLKTCDKMFKRRDRREENRKEGNGREGNGREERRRQENGRQEIRDTTMGINSIPLFFPLTVS